MEADPRTRQTVSSVKKLNLSQCKSLWCWYFFPFCQLSYEKFSQRWGVAVTTFLTASELSGSDVVSRPLSHFCVRGKSIITGMNSLEQDKLVFSCLLKLLMKLLQFYRFLYPWAPSQWTNTELLLLITPENWESWKMTVLCLSAGHLQCWCRVHIRYIISFILRRWNTICVHQTLKIHYLCSRTSKDTMKPSEP